MATPTGDHRALCGYSLRPGVPACNDRASLHLLVDVPDGPVGVETCDEHETIARQAAPVLGEHPHAGVCGLPATWWGDAGCILDDSGVEPRRAEP